MPSQRLEFHYCEISLKKVKDDADLFEDQIIYLQIGDAFDIDHQLGRINKLDDRQRLWVISLDLYLLRFILNVYFLIFLLKISL